MFIGGSWRICEGRRVLESSLRVGRVFLGSFRRVLGGYLERKLGRVRRVCRKFFERPWNVRIELVECLKCSLGVPEEFMGSL